LALISGAVLGWGGVGGWCDVKQGEGGRGGASR
jgi:hypothetical protein